MKKLFIVVNVDWFFLSHRKDIALAAQRAGWDVTIVTADTGKLKDIEALGLKVINLPMSRSGMNIKEELGTLSFLRKLYKREKPDVVHHVGMKTILWGTLAAKFAKVRGVVNAVSGLGGFFAEDNKSLLAKIMPKVLRFSHHGQNLLVIFQNHEDEAMYVKKGIIKKEQARFIKGSGVNLQEFCYTPEPDSDKVKVILTARMIEEKGVFLLTDAAERLRREYENKAEFWLVGGIDDHPGAITKEQLDVVCDGKYIKWLGYRTDVKELLQSSHIVAFPSYYMEGLPKSLIEATAIGRPIITTCSIGCKDTVDDGVNGFLIPTKDVDALTEKLHILIDEAALRQRMGRAGREKAEKEFSLDVVIEKHLSIYKELLMHDK
jgi:glycosyltransferase involved in cell wall biosynthesis